MSEEELSKIELDIGSQPYSVILSLIDEIRFGRTTIAQLTMRCDQLITALTKVSQFPECPEGILKITTGAIEEWG